MPFLNYQKHVTVLIAWIVLTTLWLSSSSLLSAQQGQTKEIEQKALDLETELSKTAVKPIREPIRIIDPIEMETKAFSLHGTWLFRLTQKRNTELPDFQDYNWESIEAPGSWENLGYKKYDGYAIYRLPVVFPLSSLYQNLVIRLGRIGDVDEVYLDGKLIGKTGSFPPHVNPNKRKERVYPIPTGLIQPEKVQFFTVKIYNHSGVGGFLGGPIEIVLMANAMRSVFLNEGLKIGFGIVIFSMAIILSLFYIRIPSENEILFYTLASYLYVCYLIFTNNIFDILATSQLIRLKIMSFFLVFLPLSILGFFLLMLKKMISKHFTVLGISFFILFFSIIVSQSFSAIQFLLENIFPVMAMYPIGYSYFILIKDYQLNKNRSIYLLAALTITVLATINDFLKFHGLFWLPEASHYAGLIFFTLCGLLIGSRMFDEKESLIQENQDLESNLIKKISNININTKNFDEQINLAYGLKTDLANVDIGFAPGFRFELVTRPYEQIGSDFFESFQIYGSKNAILLVDLAKNGISSAILAAWLKISLSRIVTKKLSLPRLRSDIEKTILSQQGGEEKFSAILLSMDSKKRCIQIINQNYSPPLFYSAKNKLVSKIEAYDKKDTVYYDLELPMKKGDKLFVSSNGIANSTSLTQAIPFGKRRIEEFFFATHKVNIQDLGELLFTEIEVFMEGKKQDNDWTMLVIEAV